jgi:putative ABC transport system permease protein
MNIAESVHTGFLEIWMHKMRSLLTMLGVIFGIAAVIATWAIGAGAREELDRQLAQLGTNTIRVRAVEMRGADAMAGARRSPYGLTRSDIASIREIATGISHVAPMKRVEYQPFVDGRSLSAEVYGTSPDLPEIVGYRLSRGRFITELDMEDGKQVAVIGEEIRRTAFPLDDPIGKTLSIRGQVYTVVGVLAPRGVSSDTVISTLNVDRAVLLPIDTVFMRLGTGGDRRAERLDEIILKAGNPETQRLMPDLVETILLRLHSNVRDFEIIVPEELIRQQQETGKILGNVLLFVAGISLFVGGIGIMNIMLATVTQRTREIGVRRALGATRSDILGQFIIESLIISLLGGILGIGIGYGLAYMIGNYSGWEVIIPTLAIIVSTGVAGLVGFLSGLYPSIKASRLDPIEALRTE